VITEKRERKLKRQSDWRRVTRRAAGFRSGGGGGDNGSQGEVQQP